MGIFPYIENIGANAREFLYRIFCNYIDFKVLIDIINYINKNKKNNQNIYKDENTINN
ncbi:hypothetical protein P148_SR1C00001G0255 [candidate division SR1 bacterium RAAC1_SR1_1]|nr:hypothetical protein P148_SR1C00001G0255 [candidate division SR1 bacterium RAAC1_SR1_1]